MVFFLLHFLIHLLENLMVPRHYSKTNKMMYKMRSNISSLREIWGACRQKPNLNWVKQCPNDLRLEVNLSGDKIRPSMGSDSRIVVSKGLVNRRTHFIIRKIEVLPSGSNDVGMD